MQFNNNTPFPAISWEVVDADNNWHVTTLARVKFKFHPTDKSGIWELRPDPKQGELFGEDEYYGEVGESSIRFESDYVSYKPNTDVIINAASFSPNNEKKVSWNCGVEIFCEKGKLLKHYGLKVKGEKKYLKAGPIWSTSFRKKATQVSLRYEKAYGGTIMIPAKDESQNDKYIASDLYNPIGCGIKKIKDPKQTVYSPQVQYLEKIDSKAPPGFGFINRSWKSRLLFGGTYDKEWIDKQHPLPPHDFNDLYNQGAHPELVMDGYLKMGTQFELTNLMRGEEVQKFTLPQLMFYNQCATQDAVSGLNKLNIDTVVIDIEDEEDMSVYVTWRIHQEKTPSLQTVHLHLLALENTGVENG